MPRAAGPFTPLIARMVTHSEMWHRYVPESGNWHDGTFTRWIAALSAAPWSDVRLTSAHCQLYSASWFVNRNLFPGIGMIRTVRLHGSSMSSRNSLSPVKVFAGADAPPTDP